MSLTADDPAAAAVMARQAQLTKPPGSLGQLEHLVRRYAAIRHDETVKRGGGAAGHNGLRSMDRMLGTPDYWRVRLGIGHPGHKDRVTGHVLGDFAKADQAWLAELLDAVADAAPLLAGDRPEDFMTRVALLTQQT